jgi:hypothetical protein
MADQTAMERLQVRKLRKIHSFHSDFSSCLSRFHVNDTNRQERIVNANALDLLP